MQFSTDQNTEGGQTGQLSCSLVSLREKVLALWETKALAGIVAASSLPHSILIDTLPAFYDNLIEAVSPNYSRENATSGSTVARSHGDERAQLSSYSAVEIVLEYQMLDEAIVEAVTGESVYVSLSEWEIIRRSIHLGMLDALRQFTLSQVRLRERLAASLAHDMRNPLSGMLLRAQLLNGHKMPKKVRELARKIKENGDRLSFMLDELLDALAYGGGEKLPLHLSSFDLLAVAQDAGAQINETKQARCDISGESIIGFWCANSIRRALDNLISNAIKYGDGGLITIHTARWNDRVSLSVHNTGDSLPEDQVERLFEHLWRENLGDSRGWGIGLSFVKKVAQSHGGSVTIDSAPGRGTTFTLDFPLDARDVSLQSI